MTNTKTDYRVVLTRKIFKQTLLQLMKQKPIAEITIKELCEMANVNRGTFYAHYKDIYELLHQIEDEMFLELQKMLATTDFENLGGRDFFAELCKFFRDNQDFCSVLIGPNNDQQFVEKILETGKVIFLGLNKVDVDENILSLYYSFYAAGCISVLRTWVYSGMKESVEQMGELLSKLIPNIETL